MTMNEKEVIDFHQAILVWDNHGCLPLRPDDSFLPELERYRRSGVNVVSLNISFDLVSFDTGIRVLAKFRSWIKSHDDRYRLADSIQDIRDNALNNRLSIVFDVEGIGSIGDDIELIDLYYDLGVRWGLLAYNKNNIFAGGCMDEDAGLTAQGRTAVRRMSDVGMVTCCSHVGERTALDVMGCATQPVIFSHSNPAGVYSQNRNISDSLIKACAETEGVVGVNGVGIFLGENDTRISTMVKHIAYVADLVGVEYIGISLDFMFDDDEIKEYFRQNRDMFPAAVYGDKLEMIQPESYPEITRELLAIGFNEAEVAKIMGENWFRIAKLVWK